MTKANKSPAIQLQTVEPVALEPVKDPISNPTVNDRAVNGGKVGHLYTAKAV